MFAGASLRKSPFAWIVLAFALSGANPLAAEEVATVIAPPAARWGAVAPCRIVLPTFEPKAESRANLTPTRYPGGARLSLPVAAPCPVKLQTLDL
jgi:hypothetical protein